MANYTLQILHASDMEGGGGDLLNAPAFVSIVDHLEDQSANSLFLSSGDLVLPGPFMAAAGDSLLRSAIQRANEEWLGLAPGTLSDVREGAGRVDLTLANLLGADAITLGNHEFDQGTNSLADLLRADIRGDDLGSVRWLGSQFPYLSANLDFSADSALAGQYTDEILQNTDFAMDLESLTFAASSARIAPATIVEEGGERIGIIGATTQILESISSTGGVDVVGTDSNDMVLLAQQLQVYIDALEAQDVNKIILMTHLQQIQLEEQLVGLLDGVDIVMAGGSNALLLDDGDALYPGSGATPYDAYPILTRDAAGNDVVLINTDGGWRYVGQLQVEFDEQGRIVTESITDANSTVYTATDETASALWGSLDAAYAEGTKGAIAQALVGSVADLVSAKDGIIYGKTDVYLQGERAFVRTEETNLGNLTADANLWYARQIDETVTVSIKNGGGIREPIGTTFAVGSEGEYELLPPQVNEVTGKAEGEISQLDIESSLRFNNALSILTLTRSQLVEVLEHAVAASAEGATPGQFAQVSGVNFSFDWNQPAGARIVSAAITDEAGVVQDRLVENGRFIGDTDAHVRVVTLSFLADGGDAYPFARFLAENGTLDERIDLSEAGLEEGMATAVAPGTEQDAFAEYLQAQYAENAYGAADTAKGDDTRIQNLAYREDSVLSSMKSTWEEALDAQILKATLAATFDSGAGEAGSEVVTVADGKLYSTNGALGRIDIYDAASGEHLNALDLTGIDGFDGVTSVAVSNGIVAAAIDSAGGANGTIALFSAATGELLNTVNAGGVLPDMLTFTTDGQTLLVAIEGEPVSAEFDPAGGVSLINFSAGVESASVQFIGFDAFDGQEQALREQDVRLFPGKTPSVDFEPEYIALSPDGMQAFVTLQEANTVAVLDLASATFTDLLPLGTTDHSLTGNGLDASDRDNAINIQNWPVFGLRMPDAIASAEIDGITYFATANEGDARDADVRIKNLMLDATAFPNAAELQADSQLGRLQVSGIDGDIDGDGDYDQLFAYGSRSFTLYDGEGNEVFDSGDQFERILAEIRPDRFNHDAGELEGRSDNKGPEPEAIALGAIGDDTYAFIGLERDNGIMVYNISKPAQSEFIGYIDAEAWGHVSPEVIKFIPASESATGKPQLAVAFEVSGTAALIDLDQLGSADHRLVFGTDTEAALVESVYRGLLGRESEAAGAGYWIEQLEHGMSEQHMIASVMASAEFNARGLGSDAQFIEALYTDLLGREYDLAGFDYWNQVLSEGMARQGVFQGFLSSDEHRINLLGIMSEGVDYLVG